jgi:hypothetical protein
LDKHDLFNTFIFSVILAAVTYDTATLPGTTASKKVLGPTKPPIQWLPGTLSLVIKRPGRKADHSPPSSVEVKEGVELKFHSPRTPSWRGAQLKKAQGQLYLFVFTLSGIGASLMIPEGSL